MRVIVATRNKKRTGRPSNDRDPGTAGTLDFEHDNNSGLVAALGC